MFAIVAALWITETVATGVGVGLALATQVNLPGRVREEVVIHNQTDHPIKLSYFNYADIQMIRNIDGRRAQTWQDINRQSETRDRSINTSVGFNGNTVAHGQSDAHTTSTETQAQRGNDQSQNVAFGFDEQLRRQHLSSQFLVDVGPERETFIRADEGHWQVTVYDALGQRELASHKVFYEAKYIVITQLQDGRLHKIKAHNAIPAEVSQVLGLTPERPEVSITATEMAEFSNDAYRTFDERCHDRIANIGWWAHPGQRFGNRTDTAYYDDNCKTCDEIARRIQRQQRQATGNRMLRWHQAVQMAEGVHDILRTYQDERECHALPRYNCFLDWEVFKERVHPLVERRRNLLSGEHAFRNALEVFLQLLSQGKELEDIKEKYPEVHAALLAIIDPTAEQMTELQNYCRTVYW